MNIKQAIARFFLTVIKADGFVSTKKLEFLENDIAPKYRLEANNFEQTSLSFDEAAMKEVVNLIKGEEGQQYLRGIGQSPSSLVTDMEILSKIDSGNSHENVIEYGNIYSIGRIGLSYPPEYNQVIRFIKNARLLYPIDRMKQRNWLEKRIKMSYWPDEDDPLYGDLFGEMFKKRTESEESKGVFSKTIVTISNCCRVEVKAFPDSHGRWFYWWDRYLNDNIASGIEIFPWVDARDTYILFATDPHQPPLLCTGPFLNANIRKGIFHY